MDNQNYSYLWGHKKTYGPIPINQSQSLGSNQGFNSGLVAASLMLHLYLQLCWAGECLQPALISSQYQNRRQNTWAATVGHGYIVYSGQQHWCIVGSNTGTRGHSAGTHSQHGGISGVPTIAVKKYTESKGRNIAFCTMHQCTLCTIHQCCYVLLCPARLH